MRNTPKNLLAASALVAISASAAAAATTPYDLIRPTWPLSWDSAAFDNFDTTISEILGDLPTEIVPPNFKAGELMADTVDQAYLDAINQHISPIRVNQAGYLKSDTERQFYYVGEAKSFEVVDAMGKSLSTKVTGDFLSTGDSTTSSWLIKTSHNSFATNGDRYTIDFTGPSGTILVGNIPQSVPTETRLRIKVGDELSSTFIVSEDVYTMVKDAVIKFFGIQRSGNSESWFHGPSHLKDGAGPIGVSNEKTSPSLNESKAGSLQGGWYDCGDHLKESLTQAYAFMALAVMSATNPTKDVDHYAYNHSNFVNTDGIPDMLREAKHGADFFLRAYRAAKGVIDDMPVSIGENGPDHIGWARPEVSESLPEDRGGVASRSVRLGELGSNVSGEIATGLAILAKDYAPYDKAFADSCLKVAEEMYDFAKNLALGKSTYGDSLKFKYNTIPGAWGTPAYAGNRYFHDDLALASVALLYATGKKEYLNDAIMSEDVGVEPEPSFMFFKGGWMQHSRDGMRKMSNTDWSSQHTFALYALYKLILSDSTKAKAFGLTEEERLDAIEHCVATMIHNASTISAEGKTITLPSAEAYYSTISYNSTWYFMMSLSDWVYNRYQAGNIFDVMAYADVAADIEKQGLTLPNLGKAEWKANEMHQLGINQLNYLLGVNPWDISFIYGVGDKNDNHPHHRASNPEGRDIPTFEYKYVRPVGGLFGGATPDGTASMGPTVLSWKDYFKSETCLDASTTLIASLTIASNGGSKYYEKKCDNCGKSDPNPFANTTPYATAYKYDWDELQAVSLWIYNNTMSTQDSLTAYIYYEATENQVKNGEIKVDLEICQLYGSFGKGSFQNACSFDMELRTALRNGNPEKIESSYNKDTKTYMWALPLAIDSIPLGVTLRMDLFAWSGLDKRLPAKIDFSDSWSFSAHDAEKGKPAYEGIPSWDKDQGEIQAPPQDPYIVIERNGKRLWGYAPTDTVEVPKDTAKVDDKTDDGKKKDGIIAIPSFQFASLRVNGSALLAQAPAQGTKTIKIFDLLGNVVMVTTFEGESAQVNLANTSKRGTLIVRLSQSNKVLATKAVRIK